jgi:hypothetical protein
VKKLSPNRALPFVKELLGPSDFHFRSIFMRTGMALKNGRVPLLLPYGTLSWGWNVAK